MPDLNLIRAHFPALQRQHNGRPLVYFDGPGGTQVPQACLDGIADYLTQHNANHGGAFITAVESDRVVAEAHELMADFLNAHISGEIIFGANMTTLTFAFSRAIGQTLQPGDEIILTCLDHDANFSPWTLMARDRGVTVRVVDIDPADCTLTLSDFERYLSNRTRLVVFGYASNAVGTINPVKRITQMAHAAGAFTYIDAVHYAPHGAINVQDIGCDFLACSPYKFFAPHMGALYGRRELLESLAAYKVRPADDALPSKFETGTQNHEAMAGLVGTFHYLEWLGSTYGDGATAGYRSPRAGILHAAMRAAHAHEDELKQRMLDGLLALPAARIYGITERKQLAERVPTFAIRMGDEHPLATAQKLAKRGICVWAGNYYALNLTERLGVESSGGMLRIGAAHYNTNEEVDYLLDCLK